MVVDLVSSNMDNTSLFYRARYRSAEQLAVEGKFNECLEILWDLRLDPNVGLYRRALVNLLIACTTDVRKHPDKSKFAQECIDLIAQVRRGGMVDAASDKELTRMQNHAEQTLKDIGAEIQKAKARREAKKTGKTGKHSMEAITTTVLGKLELDDYKPVKQGAMEVKVGESGGVEDTWTIEGAYTDLMIGDQPKSDGQQQKEPVQLDTPPPSSPLHQHD